MLSVFKACGVPDDVFAIVVGESVLNDAVAIVLTLTVLALDDDISDPSLAQVLKAVALFVFDFASSLAIGAAFGFATAATMKRLGFKKRGSKAAAAAVHRHPPSAAEREADTLLSISLCFAFPWASFYVSEALQMSGVVTLLFCGIVMARHVRPLLSEQAFATLTFKCVALVAETFVFVYLGEAIFLPHLARHRLEVRRCGHARVWMRPPARFLRRALCSTARAGTATAAVALAPMVAAAVAAAAAAAAAAASAAATAAAPQGPVWPACPWSASGGVDGLSPTAPQSRRPI